MPKKKRSKAFWNNIKFKYKLTIINENTLEEVVGLRVSKLNGFSVLLSTVIVIFVITATIITFTPLRNYLPGYMNSEVRQQVVRNALSLDSLEQLVHRQNSYILNLQDIFSGKIKAEQTESFDSLLAIREDSLMQASLREEEFRKEYEDAEKYNLTTIGETVNLHGLTFSSPVSGILLSRFNSALGHLGVELVAGTNASIVSVLDGTVVLSTYTAEAGYLIAVQHTHDFMSIYKNCGSLLKPVGESVKSGEVIGLAKKNTGEKKDIPVRFELWLKGRPVNPENYIVF